VQLDLFGGSSWVANWIIDGSFIAIPHYPLLPETNVAPELSWGWKMFKKKIGKASWQVRAVSFRDGISCGFFWYFYISYMIVVFTMSNLPNCTTFSVGNLEVSLPSFLPLEDFHFPKCFTTKGS